LRDLEELLRLLELHDQLAVLDQDLLHLLLGERREPERVQVGVLQPERARGALRALARVAQHAQSALEVLGCDAGVPDEKRDAALEPLDVGEPQLQLGL
jgi:hypothetical protein